MANINIFDKTISVRDFYCVRDNSNTKVKVDKPYINLYVVVTTDCNAECDFCCCKDSKIPRVGTNFDLYKFYYIVHELSKVVRINKVSFTGGEPTLQFDKLMKLLKIVKEVDKDTFTVVSTNGKQLHLVYKLLESELVNNVALSRHDFNDKRNNELFKVTSVEENELMKMGSKLKEKLHLSCNLIKGYIDSAEKVKEYLNFAASVGVCDVGFVTLMKVNEYCKNHHIDFKDLKLEENGLFLTKTWNNGTACRCNNYLYISKYNENVVRVYARYQVDRSCSETQLVFNGQALTNGFEGEVII